MKPPPVATGRISEVLGKLSPCAMSVGPFAANVADRGRQTSQSRHAVSTWASLPEYFRSPHEAA